MPIEAGVRVPADAESDQCCGWGAGRRGDVVGHMCCVFMRERLQRMRVAGRGGLDRVGHVSVGN